VNDLCSAESGDCEDSAAIRSSPASAADDSSAELDSEPIDMRGADWIAEPGSWSPRCSFACCTASARLIVCWKARSKQSGSSHWWCARLLGCWGQIMLEWIASRWLSPLGLLVARLSLSLFLFPFVFVPVQLRFARAQISLLRAHQLGLTLLGPKTERRFPLVPPPAPEPRSVWMCCSWPNVGRESWYWWWWPRRALDLLWSLLGNGSTARSWSCNKKKAE